MQLDCTQIQFGVKPYMQWFSVLFTFQSHFDEFIVQFCNSLEILLAWFLIFGSLKT